MAKNPIPKKSLFSIVNTLFMLKNAFCLFVNKVSVHYTLSGWSCSLLPAETYYFYIVIYTLNHILMACMTDENNEY